MTRRLLVAAAASAALCGLGASLVPAHAGNNGGRICIGGSDDRRPGGMNAVCINDPLPSL